MLLLLWPTMSRRQKVPGSRWRHHRRKRRHHAANETATNTTMTTMAWCSNFRRRCLGCCCGRNEYPWNRCACYSGRCSFFGRPRWTITLYPPSPSIGFPTKAAMTMITSAPPRLRRAVLNYYDYDQYDVVATLVVADRRRRRFQLLFRKSMPFWSMGRTTSSQSTTSRRRSSTSSSSSGSLVNDSS